LQVEITPMKKQIFPITFFMLFPFFIFPFSLFAQLTITPSVTNATCPNSSNGSISVSVSGGTSPYTYQWLPYGQTTPDITGLTTGTYSVIVTDNDGSSSTASYEVGPVPFSYPESMTECSVIPASYFTPNGDGYNDTWQIANAQYFDNIHLIVFDRWGTRVHEQKGTYELWDGKSYFGIPVPDAVYYYFFYQDKDDKQKQAKSGSVTILR